MFAKGDGYDEIQNYDTGIGVDIVKFTDATLLDISALTRSSNDLIIKTFTGDQLTIDNYFSEPGYQIDQFQFADGAKLVNFVVGSDADENLNGTDGNDALSGLKGADTLTGGVGNDLYLVNDAGDKVLEDAKAGTDTIMSSVDYTLPVNVENLTLLPDALAATGNTLDNMLTGWLSQ